MSLDKLVDSTQLDTDLASVANAIRTKGGTSAQLAFPAGFVSAIGDIQTGGTDQFAKYINGELDTYASDEVLNIATDAFKGAALMKNISFPNCTKVKSRGCMESGIQSAYLPKVTNIEQYGFRSGKLIYAVFPSLVGLGGEPLSRMSTILGADFGKSGITLNIPDATFFNDTNLTVLILRYDTVVALTNVGAFSSTPFKSGGTGGTIYIPKSLYDHLGDGTANDYKAASNWSTVDGYGTITWAKIEGSQYETHYVDGSTIPT